MIKAQELRIGNIHKGVDISHPRMGISSVKIDGQSFNYITSYGIYMVDESKLQFEPILLTDAWFKAFGFELIIDPDNEIMMKNGWADANHYSMITNKSIGPSTNLIIYKDGSSNHCFTQSGRLKYVHEVQNLYFALTGQELKVK